MFRLGILVVVGCGIVYGAGVGGDDIGGAVVSGLVVDLIVDWF